MKQKEIQERISLQVKNELEKHQIYEVIQDLYIKNKFDADLLEEKARNIETN